tara:strand:+ start:71166 stop:71882 length:717 start_codon:yes stop_codon:yes gene_type:complete
MATNVNPPDGMTLDAFRGVMAEGDGGAKAARYIVRINAPPIPSLLGNIAIWRDLSFLCEAAEMPGRQFMVNENRYYGPTFKTPAAVEYQDLQLTFLCRDKFRERKLFDDWMDAIQPIGTFEFNYRDKYATTIEVFQMSDVGEVVVTPATDPTGLPIPRANPLFTNQALKDTHVYRMVFEKAYPVAVLAQPLSGSDGDYMRLQVLFTYVRWTRGIEEYKDPFQLVTPTSGISQKISPTG